jgi:hypothetical protein
MNSFIALTLIILIYLGLIYLLFKKILIKHYWDTAETNSNTAIDTPLTAFAQKSLGFLLSLQIIVFLVIPLVVLVVTFTNTFEASWGIDISIFSGFNMDLSKFPGVEYAGLRQPEISGKAMINIDTHSINAWYLSIAIKELYLLFSLYVIFQLRSLVICIRKGLTFSNDNSKRLENIGIAIIGFNIIIPFVQYFGWGFIVNTITFNTDGFSLFPALELNMRDIAIGLMIIIFARILKQATDIQKEQELTI